MVAALSDCVLDWLARVRPLATVITRLRLEAALDDAAAPRSPGPRGRPRNKGTRRPTLAPVAWHPAPSWRRVTVGDGDGQGGREIEWATGWAGWDHVGKSVVPSRGVLIRKGQGGAKTHAWLCPDRTLSALEIVRHVMARWQVDVTCEASRVHLGVGTLRQWNERAIARGTPV